VFHPGENKKIKGMSGTYPALLRGRAFYIFDFDLSKGLFEFETPRVCAPPSAARNERYLSLEPGAWSLEPGAGYTPRSLCQAHFALFSRLLVNL
jgi:hypothetical protein